MLPKHQIFAQEYLIDLNATQAALRAGYSKGYAGHASTKLLRRPAIQAAIAAAMAARAERTRITADRVLLELARIAFADVRKLVSRKNGKIELRDLYLFNDDDAAAIAELSRSAEGGIRLKFYDKRPALDALARHTGLFDKTETTPYGADIRTEAQTRARAALKERIEKIIKEQGAEEKPAE